MILERSKVLQSENTSLRMEKDRLSDDLVSTKRELVDKTKEWERQQRLVTELEDHVERLQVIASLCHDSVLIRQSHHFLFITF